MLQMDAVNQSYTQEVSSFLNSEEIKEREIKHS